MSPHGARSRRTGHRPRRLRHPRRRAGPGPEGTTVKGGTRGCVVLSGTLAEPYTPKTIAFRRGQRTSDLMQIDHVVPLGDAWQTGAQQWDTTRRTALADDRLNLLAVDGRLNEAKGDGDAATWLPPNEGFRCAYAARQVAVMEGVAEDGRAMLANFSDQHPLGCTGQPQEVAEVIALLASPASNFMTGALVMVDGGWTAQ